MINYSEILTINYADSQWAITDNSYDLLTWYSNTPKPTQTELDALWESTQNAVAINQCATQAKALLAQSDWSQLPDVGLKNAAAFVTYRGILRGYVTQPVVDPDWPVEPTPVWE